MSFIASTGVTNVDLMYVGMPRVPSEGEEIFSSDFRVQLGGGAPGTLVTAARLGLPARLATYLGDDLFSTFARAEFERSGVMPRNLYTGEGIPLNVTSVMLTPGDRTFATYCTPTEITDALCDAVYQMSTGARIVQMQLGFLPVYEKLREEGTTLLFDIGWDDQMSLEKYKDYLRLADYFTPNTREALQITGKDTPEEAIRVLADYIEKPLVKLDKDGCLVLEDGVLYTVPNIPEFVCRDATGAGDAFLAGLMYGLYHGYTFPECVLFGNITGGKCVTGIGCLTAWVNESELLTLARKYHGFIKETGGKS